MTGTRFVFAIVMTVDTGVAEAGVEKLSTAVQFTVYDPACVKFGVPESVMLGFASGPAELEAVRNGALFVCDNVTNWPASGSDAEPVTLNAAFSEPLAVAGAEMTGTWLPVVTVSVVVTGVALPTGELLSTAVQLIVNVPACARVGVAVSVMLGFNDGPAELEAG